MNTVTNVTSRADARQNEHPSDIRHRCACGNHTIAGSTCSACQNGISHVQRQSYYGRHAIPQPVPIASELRTTGTKSNSVAYFHLSSVSGKAEAAFDDTEPEKDVKKENGGVVTRIGALSGGAVGAVAGGLIGGVPGAVIGGVAGAGVGALASYLIGRTAKGGTSITWPRPDYSSDNTNGSSTTVEKPFAMKYDAIDDSDNDQWKLKIASITGGATIHVRTGASRDPFNNPPVSEAEAQNAITVMKGYYVRGLRGAWHTEAASRAHEKYHYEEWQCSGNHYWPVARTAIEDISISKSTQPTKAGAVTSMRSGASGADAVLAGFRQVSHDYWFTLDDNAQSRPYAAGQQALNPAVRHVQNLASANGWSVPQGIDTPSKANPCYQPRLPYAP